MSVDRFIPEKQTATIESSETTSGAINLSGLQLVAIVPPAEFTGSSVSFTACTTVDGTYVPVREVGGGAVYTATVGTTESRWVPVDVRVFAGIPFLKIVSSGTEGATRSIEVIARPVS